MEKGFKSRCEEMARTLRVELELPPIAPLLVESLAAYLRVPIWPVTELGLSDEDVRQLVIVDPSAWSAITVSASGREAIVVNPRHRAGRYSSDVMHELAHLLLGHEPSTMFFAGDQGLALRGYVGSAEEEANWLAAALLLPRDALVHVAHKRIDQEEVCDSYGVSRQMLTFRLNVTGVSRQFGRRHGLRANLANR